MRLSRTLAVTLIATWAGYMLAFFFVRHDGIFVFRGDDVFRTLMSLEWQGRFATWQNFAKGIWLPFPSMVNGLLTTRAADYVVVPAVLNAVFSALTALGIYLIARQFTLRREASALFPAALALGIPVFFHLSVSSGSEPIFLFLIVFTFRYLLAYRRSGRFLDLLRAAAFLTLADMTRFEAWFLSGILAVEMAFSSMLSGRRRATHLLLGVAPFLFSAALSLSSIEWQTAMDDKPGLGSLCLLISFVSLCPVATALLASVPFLRKSADEKFYAWLWLFFFLAFETLHAVFIPADNFHRLVLTFVVIALPLAALPVDRLVGQFGRRLPDAALFLLAAVVVAAGLPTRTLYTSVEDPQALRFASVLESAARSFGDRPVLFVEPNMVRDKWLGEGVIVLCDWRNATFGDSLAPPRRMTLDELSMYTKSLTPTDMRRADSATPYDGRDYDAVLAHSRGFEAALPKTFVQIADLGRYRLYANSRRLRYFSFLKQYFRNQPAPASTEPSFRFEDNYPMACMGWNGGPCFPGAPRRPSA